MLVEEQTNDRVYRSCFEPWDRFSVIRSRPRRVLSEYTSDKTLFYPPDRQPLIVHPLVILKAQPTIEAILIHSAYKFMLDIAEVEVNCIVKAALRIYNNEFDYHLPQKMSEDMLSIIIDEAHHAYIALDYVSQIESSTKIKPVQYQHDVELNFYIKKYIAKLDTDAVNAFELIAICLGENTLTKELFQMRSDSAVHPFFNDVMSDHMFDEGRHSKIFRQALSYTWQSIDIQIQNKIIDILPAFILDYVGNELNIISSRKILMAVGFSQNESQKIIEDTYPEIKPNQLLSRNPVAANIMSVLDRTGITRSDYAKKVFSETGLLDEN